MSRGGIPQKASIFRWSGPSQPEIYPRYTWSALRELWGGLWGGSNHKKPKEQGWHTKNTFFGHLIKLPKKLWLGWHTEGPAFAAHHILRPRWPHFGFLGGLRGSFIAFYQKKRQETLSLSAQNPSIFRWSGPPQPEIYLRYTWVL